MTIRPRIALIACSKTKSPLTCTVKEMYTSALFRLSLTWSLKHCDRAFVLSARHGLLDLNTVIEPYNYTLSMMTAAERTAWGRRVGAALDARVSEPDAAFIILAGSLYVNALELPNNKSRSRLLDFYEPMRGLEIGQRLAWLKAGLFRGDYLQPQQAIIEIMPRARLGGAQGAFVFSSAPRTEETRHD